MIGVTLAFLLTPAQVEAYNSPVRELWAFRSVIDKRARIATFALAKDFWLSYDATYCNVYKFWKGDVKFNGAVYTTEHGPQPTSQGGSIFENSTEESQWVYQKGGVTKGFTPRFRGYFFDSVDAKKVVLQYDFELEGQKGTIFETPTMLWEKGKPVGLQRQFLIGTRAKSVITPIALNGVQIGLKPYASASGVASQKYMGMSPEMPDAKSPFFIKGSLATVQTLINPVMSEPAGQVQLVSTANEILATARISDGGKSYEANQGGGNQTKGDLREPGLAFRGYQLEFAPERMPTLVPNQSPNVNRKIDSVFFLSTDDFEMKGRFLVNLTGWLKVTKGGLYQFRLTSDDGSRLYLRGEKVVDNDGVHNAEKKVGSVELDPGSHPLRIDYFNNAEEGVLQLEWKTPDATEWEIVPDEAFETIADEVHVVAPGFKKVMDSLWPQRPGDGRPEVSVHPSLSLSTPRPEGFTPRVGGIDFLPNGDLVLCTWDPEGAVFQLSGVQTGDPSKVKVKKIAQGLAEPLGIKYVNGNIYVLQKQELTKLVDNNGDGVIDEFYALANNWGVTENFHEFAFGLVYKDGYFYGNLAIAIDPGGRSTGVQEKARGRVVKINGKTGDFEYVASGLRTPNGIALNTKGEIFLTDNQGDWNPSCKLFQLIPGAFYGNRSVEPGIKATDTLPVCWFPQGEIGNSTSQPATFEYGPYKGQMIVGDVTHGGLKRVFMEKVNGLYQGTAFRLTQGLEAGINRVVIGPDKAIYVGGIGSTGNWGQEGKERFGLQRLAYNGKSTFEMLSVKPAKNGAEIEFTQPLNAQLFPLSLDEYFVQQWKYVPTIDYGGPKVDEQRLAVKGISMSSDRKKMFLQFDGVKPGYVVYFRLPSSVRSATNELLWSTEAWSTVNSIPNRIGGLQPVPTKSFVAGISEAEKMEGFVSLFDGKSTDSFRGYRRQDMPKGWVINEGTLTYIPGVGGGDIITKDQFKDFELRLDWKIQTGGNSGIMYHVKETRGASYETGVEMQILDDAKHPDGKLTTRRAGSLYDIYELSKPTAYGANEWNSIRIVARGTKVEHWMNGVKVVEYDRTSADYKARFAKSKFKDWPEFAKYDEGHIAFQDHGDLVAFRNIRIRKF